jgi:2',3'-cyclic-nucleotide 2'-phosphodiesterase (5'-nucleotidase family)
MARARYDAVSLGKLEFSQWALTEELMKQHPLPVVCTNVEQLVDGEWLPVGRKSIVTEVNGVTIGIVSAISSAEVTGKVISDAQDSIRLLPPLEEVQRQATWLKEVEGVEVVVLLAMVDHKSMEQYASLLNHVDVMVGGVATRFQENPELIGNVIVNRSGARGQRVGSTRLIVSPLGEIVDFGGVNLVLTSRYPEDAEVQARVEEARAETNRLREERSRAARERAQQLQEG